MILAAALDPLYLVVAVPAFILAFALFVGRFLAAGGAGDDDAVLVTLRDRDGLIVERSALTPTLVHQSSGAPHAKRYRLDRRRSAHPGE